MVSSSRPYSSWGFVFDQPYSGLIVGPYWRRTRPETNARLAGIGITVGCSKSAHYVIQLGGSEVSKRLLIQIEFA
jgi:hypothetical protein